MKSNFLELLAPARNLETGIAAINHGADAVYIGAKQFGARKQAGNSVDDIAKLAKYAHFYGAKVFVALNTILYDNELAGAELLIHRLYESGIDALIVQDMGVLEMDLPPIPLHASTQTHNFEPSRIEFLAKAGFERLVLARELSLAEVADIRKKVDVELEYFIHGALCVSLSGQCYLSHAQGGRSANRGECAQACRLDYQLKNSQGNSLLRNKHALSLNDLNHAGRLGDLAAAGIQSFKVEGRLKSIDYVKNTVAFYRNEIDRLLVKGIGTKASAGTVTTLFQPDLERSFHRSATNYFLDGRISDMANFDSPKSTGKEVGTVTKLARNGFEMNTNEVIANGDGVCFVGKSGKLTGLRVNKVSGKLLEAQIPKELQVGMRVFRNHDEAFEKKLAKSDKCRKIEVEIQVYETKTGFVVLAQDESGFSATFELSSEKQLADKPELALENIKKQLSKSGGTLFDVTEVALHFETVYFIAAGQLNQVRRDLLAQLEQMRNDGYVRTEMLFKKTSHVYPDAKLDYRANISNRLAKQFYERHGVLEIEKAFELLESKPNAKLMTTRYCVKFEMKQCPVHHKSSAKKDIEPLYLENKLGRFRLEFDCKACLMHVVKA